MLRRQPFSLRLIALVLAGLPLAASAASPFQMRLPIGDGATPPAYAAASSIPGFNYASDWYKAAQAAFSYSNGTYTAVSGNLQAAMLVSSTSGATALANMQANPAGVAGTLAQTWLAGYGFSYSNGQWLKTSSYPADWYPNNKTWQQSTYAGGICYPRTGFTGCTAPGAADDYVKRYYNGTMPAYTSRYVAQTTASWIEYVYRIAPSSGGGTLLVYIYTSSAPVPPPPTAPATASDWAALPDPTPAVGAELPYAPYMPQGAPVGSTTITDLNTGKTYTCTNGACG